VLFEVKPGPYEQLADGIEARAAGHGRPGRGLTDKDFALWAPAEGDARCAAFERWYCAARPGDRPPTV
jgi:hypothetical protein